MKINKYFSIALILSCFFTLNAQTIINTTEEKNEQADESKAMPNAQVAMSSPNYPVTAGDIYSLNFAVGNNVLSYSIPVDSTYKIRIANMGVINCQGLTYMELKAQVETLVLKNYPMSGVQFLLTSPSVFTVTVTGEVNRTKEYNAWPLTRLSALVGKSFSEYSSRRNITIENQKGEVKQYDLFLSSRKGDLSQDPLLRPGDKITVAKVDRIVTIAGAVERPGSYELNQGENLKALIEYYANGLELNADVLRIELIRQNNNYVESKLNDKFFLKKSDIDSDFILNNKDYISIHRISDLYPVVFVEGAVYTEVETNLDASNKLSIQFTPGEDYAYFVRNNKKMFTQSSDLDNAYIIRDGQRIPMNITPMIYDSTFEQKLSVEPNDVLVIPFKQFFITVAGAVNKPGRFPYIQDRTWEYYIGLAGGFDKTKNAHDAVEIVNIDGKRLSKKDVITPECTITAKTNSGIYYFNQYAPIVTTTLTAIVSAITITTYIESKK